MGRTGWVVQKTLGRPLLPRSKRPSHTSSRAIFKVRGFPKEENKKTTSKVTCKRVLKGSYQGLLELAAGHLGNLFGGIPSGTLLPETRVLERSISQVPTRVVSKSVVLADAPLYRHFIFYCLVRLRFGSSALSLPKRGGDPDQVFSLN